MSMVSSTAAAVNVEVYLALIQSYGEGLSWPAIIGVSVHGETLGGWRCVYS